MQAIFLTFTLGDKNFFEVQFFEGVSVKCRDEVACRGDVKDDLCYLWVTAKCLWTKGVGCRGVRGTLGFSSSE